MTCHLAIVEIESLVADDLVQGVHDGLSMTGLEPPPVGASKLYSSSRPIAVMIGMVGRSNGMLTINMTERGMLHIAGKLSGEEMAGADPRDANSDFRIDSKLRTTSDTANSCHFDAKLAGALRERS